MGEIDLEALAPWLERTETKKDVLTEGLIVIARLKPPA